MHVLGRGGVRAEETKKKKIEMNAKKAATNLASPWECEACGQKTGWIPFDDAWRGSWRLPVGAWDFLHALCVCVCVFLCVCGGGQEKACSSYPSERERERKRVMQSRACVLWASVWMCLAAHVCEKKGRGKTPSEDFCTRVRMQCWQACECTLQLSCNVCLKEKKQAQSALMHSCAFVLLTRRMCHAM